MDSVDHSTDLALNILTIVKLDFEIAVDLQETHKLMIKRETGYSRGTSNNARTSEVSQNSKRQI